MSLRSRFLILTGALVLIGLAGVWFAFERIAEGIVEQWGRQVAEIQVRYDSARLQQPLEREIALSRQLADSTAIRRFARDPDNDLHEAAAIAEMESFRNNFRDRNYFVALADNGAYYHNNAEDEYADEPLRYHLDPDDPDDAWFFRLIEEGRDFHLNVNPDTELGVTKLWIDVLIRDRDGTILGMTGTGLELDEILREIVDIDQPGITTLFADFSGAIQLYRDPEFIEFGSVVQPEGRKSTVDRLVDRSRDRQRLETMMEELRDLDDPEGEVRTDFVQVDGQRQLAGVAHLPALGWYEVTLMDLDEVMPVRHFTPVLVVFAFTLILALLLVHLALQRLIFRPLASLENAMARIQAGDLRPVDLPQGRGEIGNLIRHYHAMADAIRNQTRNLETKVRERTDALHRLARKDPLTGLVNRRGMDELLDDHYQQALHSGEPFGVIYLDLDHFKPLNDTHGHATGDVTLTRVAERLREIRGPEDRVARWGGDEFLILLHPCDQERLSQIGQAAVETAARVETPEDTPVTFSAGGHLAQPGQPVGEILERADRALYAAKASGRNRFEAV
ncbi:diguanylate cyclase domain-containing protein [Thioalkalivibrio sp. ALJ24]|uniref:sensor domain-containing diguanylate cyclase n=1 Tax=Thioalkalivibrio sp. ALJ24 TaxID=545276 RepID=UPI00035F72D9|nr:diguanylate cyclase [Thioalkalivibrio sp. ALJ24]